MRMTPWDGRFGRSDAPTMAIDRALVRSFAMSSSRVSGIAALLPPASMRQRIHQFRRDLVERIRFRPIARCRRTAGVGRLANVERQRQSPEERLAQLRRRRFGAAGPERVRGFAAMWTGVG